MAKILISNRILNMMILLIFMMSCNGQVKTEVKNEKNSWHQFRSNGQTNIRKPQGLNKEASICCGINEKGGNLWFGSTGEGVYRFDGKGFIQFTLEQGLNSNIIYSILQDKNKTIWVGTDKGLNRFNGNKFEIIPIVLNENRSNFLNHKNGKNPPFENAVWSMMQDKNSKLWLGTNDGVFCYDGKEFSRFLDNETLINKDSLDLKGIFSILEANDGTIWFTECADEGVSCFDGINLFNVIPYKEIGRTDRVIEDNKGNLWFATAFKGVGFYNGKTFTQNIFNQKKLDGQYNILEDSKGTIWFDTQEGLGCYDGKSFNTFVEKDGISVKNFIPILMDDSGNIWFSEKGMKLYKYDGKNFSSYSE